MKRSRLKRKRSTPRAWQNPKAKAAYMADHPHCECCDKLADDPEHVRSRGWHGADEPPNLMAVCRECHRALFDQSREGRIMSLWYKLKTDENFSLAWFDERVGYSLTGKLENMREEVSAQYAGMIDDLLKGHE